MPQVQSIIIAAITLFAFSGLMVGFTVGVLVRPAKPPTNNTNQINSANTTPTPKPRATPTAIATIHLGPPELRVPFVLNPDGVQTYSATIQAKDNASPAKPMTTNDITCRIWLVPAKTNVTDDLNNNRDQLQHVDTFNQPFPHEVQNALIFDPTTPNQTQLCQQGNAQWKFIISPTVDKGSYFLVGLTDWQGKAWNWSWSEITVGGKK
jgi:hypothetical protein